MAFFNFALLFLYLIFGAEILLVLVDVYLLRRTGNDAKDKWKELKDMLIHYGLILLVLTLIHVFSPNRINYH